jgi:hypothetical protein
MSGVLLHLALGLAAYTLSCSVPATAFLKFFARPLTWGQAFIILICCFVITTALIAVYFFVKVATGIPSSVNALATIATLILTGALITRLARAYGVDKAGRLGVGGKTILALLAFSWVLAGGVYVLITVLHS